MTATSDLRGLRLATLPGLSSEPELADESRTNDQEDLIAFWRSGL